MSQQALKHKRPLDMNWGGGLAHEGALDHQWGPAHPGLLKSQVARAGIRA